MDHNGKREFKPLPELQLQTVDVEPTAAGVRIKAGAREVIFDHTEDALRAWIALGLVLDRELGGQLNAATCGGLGALRRQYLAAKRVREGN